MLINLGLIQSWFYCVRDQTKHVHDFWICDPQAALIYGFLYTKILQQCKKIWKRFWEYQFCKYGNQENEFASGLLPAVSNGDKVTVDNISVTQRFSRPPARYVEASLVKKLEELGIGRPSTYAPTISTIQKRGYVEKPEKDGEKRFYTQFVLSEGNYVKNQLSEITGKEKNKLCPTDIGIVVTDFLVEHFSPLFQ